MIIIQCHIPSLTLLLMVVKDLLQAIQSFGEGGDKRGEKRGMCVCERERQREMHSLISSLTLLLMVVKDLLQAIQSLASSSGTQPWTTVQAMC